ncbi:MAG: uroporphyrinogen-III C-methyltransferase [Acidimicrobiales bacterium]
MNGTVFLVGAGPGDPGLLTRRGAEVLATADVVVHDRLTDPALLALAPATAEKVDVGKQPDDRGDQDAINQLLVARARDGLRVVRLKGGDPFVFGRGGEEALALKAAGVAFEVVPGVSAAIAAPASAGVPVTHRGLVTSFTVVAGHSRSVDTAPGAGGTNWEALAGAGGTIVVLMGAAHRQRIAERLVAGGMSPLTPVLAVQWGTGPGQASVRTTLAGLPAVALGPPLTIVIGEVAGLDLRPPTDLALSGKTVVVTRAAHQGSPLAQKLRQLGARALEVPTIALAPPADGGGALVAALERLGQGRYSWAVFTSANAVERVFDHVPDTRLLGRTKVAAVGPGTAAALRAYRVVADLVPADARAEGLTACFPAPPAPPAPRTVLLPQAAGARPELRAELGRQGWEVDAVEAYRTVPERVPPAMLTAASGADAICFASSSAVNSYLDQAGAAPLPPVVACIGPVTAATARSRGLEVHAEASEHTLDGLVAALVSRLAGPGGGSVPKA